MVAATVAVPRVTTRSSAVKAPAPAVSSPLASVNVTVTANAPGTVVSSPSARARVTVGAVLSTA